MEVGNISRLDGPEEDSNGHRRLAFCCTSESDLSGIHAIAEA